jgi:hypothetical protein
MSAIFQEIRCVTIIFTESARPDAHFAEVLKEIAGGSVLRYEWDRL